MIQTNPNRRKRFLAGSAAGLLAAAGVVALATPAAADDDCDTVDALVECVEVDEVLEHLEEFQEIADAHDGTRASGTPGYDASADYVVEELEDAGYTVQRQEFQFPFYELLAEPTFTVDSAALVFGQDFQDMNFSGAGNVQGTGVAVDPGSGTSGCEATDFVGVTGQIAVIERGACAFGQKAANAEAAGAVGAVIVNNRDGDALIGGTLGDPVGIPVLDVSQNTGPTLVGRALDISLQAVSETRTTENLVAELPGRSPNGVVSVGAHLDSVAEGPGINDNGSGSAALLELAENMAETQPEHPVRFHWWGAEEAGLLGSTHYVGTLEQAEIDNIAAYLNFDMIGSPNFARFIYDGDGSTFEAPEGYVTEESAAIEHLFAAFYDSRGLAYEDTEFDGRSDYQAFADAGIPTGGLFTGAEGVMTPEQAARYGGVAGAPYDPCYHAACDDLGNLNEQVLGENLAAIAHVTATLAGLDRGHGDDDGDDEGDDDD